MKIKPIKQKHSAGCGPTSIKMVADYFGYSVTQKKIEECCGDWRQEGMNNLDLVKVFQKLGFAVNQKNGASWEDLIKLNTSQNVIVVSWMLQGYIGHFSVVDKVNQKFIWLADPDMGKTIKLEKLLFLRLWFDYDDLDYPLKSSDIHLRWMAIVRKK